MQTPETLIRFDRLRHRLIAGGVARRHVKRTLAELGDHYDDAFIAELETGCSETDAAARAWTRLGSEDEIVRSTLARPELRSLPARFPRLIFGAGPLILWFGAIVITTLTISFVFESLIDLGILQKNPSGRDPDWLRAMLIGVCFVYFRVLPLVIGTIALVAAARQRLSSSWPMIGAVVVAVLSGTSEFAFKFTEKVGDRGEFEIGNTLITIIEPITDALGHFSVEALMPGLLLSALNLLLIFGAYTIWRRRFALL